jgi:hypothetical protein
MKTESKIIILACTLFLVIIASGYYWESSQVTDSKQPKVYSTQTANILALPDEARQEMFDSMADARWSFETIEEASAKLPFAFSIPNDTLTGKPTLIYVTKCEPVDRQLSIHYEGGINGIRYRAILIPDKPNFSASVDQLKKDMEAGINKADKAPKLIDIGGYQAFAIEPGFNIIEGDKVPRIGVVEWWKDGVLYNIYGTRGSDGTSLEQLTNIAQSVINSNTLIPAGFELPPDHFNRVANPQIQPEEMNNEKLETQEYE